MRIKTKIIEFDKGEFLMKIIETKSFKEKVPGGISSGRDPSDFSKDQIKRGIEVELEHSSDRELAKEIAMDHLEEFPNYYDELAKMEKKLKSESN